MAFLVIRRFQWGVQRSIFFQGLVLVRLEKLVIAGQVLSFEVSVKLVVVLSIVISQALRIHKESLPP
jgi:hypothetical protein